MALNKRKIYIVDDDEAIRHSASFMLRLEGFTVQTYPDGPHFLEDLDPFEQACILLDVRMPGMDGLTVQKRLNELGCGMPVIILTGHGDVPVAVEAMKDGAIDFLEKPYEKQNLLRAIRSGFEALSNTEERNLGKQQAVAKINTLTQREKDVLSGLVEGLTNKGIADQLSISPRTVEIHRANAMEKLQADSLSEALRIAFKAGFTA